MISGRLHRVRALTAALLALALSVGGLDGCLSGAQARTHSEIRASVATAQFVAVPSARIVSVGGRPSTSAANPATHSPVGGVGAGINRLVVIAAANGAAEVPADTRPEFPRRLAFRYEATAPPAAL